MAGDALEVLTYKDSFHACHVLDTLRSLYKERKLCDVTLVVENETIWAHRLILAANSSYFFSMFTSGMCETSQELIALKELDFEAVNALVEYCYTSTIVITEKNVQNILSAANLLQFMTVVETCCGFLKNQLHPSNCLGIGNFADHHGCAKLREAAQEYAEKNFLDVYKTDEFLLATLNQIQAMLTSDFLNVISEKEVFDSCIRWVRHDLDNRRAHLSELMRYIRLPLLPPKILGTYCICRQLHQLCKQTVIRFNAHGLRIISNNSLRNSIFLTEHITVMYSILYSRCVEQYSTYCE